MGNYRIKIWTHERGFSMLEVLFSLGMLGLGLSLVSSFFLQGQQIQKRTRERLELVLFATQTLEEIRSGVLSESSTFQPHPQRQEFHYRSRKVDADLPPSLGLLEVTVDFPAQSMPQSLFGVVSASTFRKDNESESEPPSLSELPVQSEEAASAPQQPPSTPEQDLSPGERGEGPPSGEEPLGEEPIPSALPDSTSPEN